MATIGGLSAHAGQEFLLEYIQATRESLREIYLVHGEEDAAEELMDKLNERGIGRVAYPPPHSSVEI